jgi:hypothetical protein
MVLSESFSWDYRWAMLGGRGRWSQCFQHLTVWMLPDHIDHCKGCPHVPTTGHLPFPTERMTQQWVWSHDAFIYQSQRHMSSLLHSPLIKRQSLSLPALNRCVEIRFYFLEERMENKWTLFETLTHSIHPGYQEMWYGQDWPPELWDSVKQQQKARHGTAHRSSQPCGSHK